MMGYSQTRRLAVLARDALAKAYERKFVNPPRTISPPMSAQAYTRRLLPPAGSVHLVIDTDAANEIDDQFALAWALSRPDRLNIHGTYATPFSFAHRRALYPHASPDAAPFNSPGRGMERSFDEILKIQALMGIARPVPTFRGSPRYLSSLHSPIESEATAHLIATALSMPPAVPLYVVALGCATNVASALLLAPEIMHKIVVVWTSAFPSHAPHVNQSFNLEQDVLASQWLYDSGVPLVYLPGYHVGAQLRLSLAEVERYVAPYGEIGRYLHDLFVDNPLWAVTGRPAGAAHSWVIWDLINIAWLLEPEWVPSHTVPAPLLGVDLCWQKRPDPHLMREGFGVQRDAIFNDLFTCLAKTRV
jgi:purine nucleosidase